MREMRTIAFIAKLIDDGKILDNSMKRMPIDIDYWERDAESLAAQRADLDPVGEGFRLGRHREIELPSRRSSAKAPEYPSINVTSRPDARPGTRRGSS
jgi:hypothetical protein